MLKSTRAALAIGLGLAGVVGMAGFARGQDPAVRQAAGNGAAKPAPPAPAGPAVIGTIDFDAVVRQYDRFKAGVEAVQAEAEKRQGDLMKRAAEYEAEREKISKLAPNSLDWKKSEERLTQLKAQADATKEQAERELSRKEAELLAEVFNDIKNMSARVGYQRGMNFVVKYMPKAAVATDPRSVQAQMAATILYANPQVDITADVVKYLNYQYQQSGGVMPKSSNMNAPANAAAPGAGGVQR